MSSELSFIYLDEDDMIMAGVRDMSRCIDTMEETFELLNQGDYRMGGVNGNDHGCKVIFPEGSRIKNVPLGEPDYRFTTMPAYLGGRFHIFGIKSYGSHHTNKTHGLPRSILMMSLLDIDTGAPIAYMSANILSAMRSAATVGVGIKHLIKNPESIGIIGPGVLSAYTLDAALTIQPTIKKLKIKGRSNRSTEDFVKRAKKNYPQLEDISICNNVEEASVESDIVFFGTTNAEKFSDNPEIRREWIKKGALIVSASSLLVSSNLLFNSDVKCVADNYAMYEEWGKGKHRPTQESVSSLLGMGYYDAVCEGVIEKSDIIDISEILFNNQTVRTDDDQIVLYAVGGMPIEDVAWGFECYNNARRLGIGTKLKIWKEPKLID